ncbi:thiamine pyrophosphate-binding protein [Lysinibacter sp. HNR]|uniref:thiamine pyrophosphate-binding protein n=1 Tax=Lysinibacter sp. HNR TaxID=3031408 RepID=UPI002434926F|nr:thiamine pyrophosphate-binding protein [Lysinibacter sp. HNR]WGD37410.1 thiamine pyrophosphate-binding protein [Lysinibacter sp. HNR]
MSASLPHTLATALSRHTTHAFGLMGNGNAHLIDALIKRGITYTAVRHESATVAAADAYTRVSGNLAIATTTYGPGFTNTLTALAEATQARTPILLVVGTVPLSGPRPWDVNQEELADAVGVSTHTLSTTDVEGTVNRAIAEALKTKRPVVLGIPYDIAAAEITTVQDDTSNQTPLTTPPLRTAPFTPASPGAASPIPMPLPMPDQAPDLNDPNLWATLETAAAALTEAQRPLVLAGRGAWLSAAGPELSSIAETLGALTATTALARGLFPEARYDLGVTGGFGQKNAMTKISEADVVLVVGASLNQFTMCFGELFGPGTVLIRIDTEPVPPPRSKAPITQLLLRGDARACLNLLGEAITATRTARDKTIPALTASQRWRERTAGLEPGGTLRFRDVGDVDHPHGLCSDGRLDPRALAVRIAQLLPSDRHVTNDGGHFLSWANMFWPITSPERMLLLGTTYQTIGLGLGTVPGIAAAAPDTTVVLNTGDGGGLMALADLETAIRTTQSCIIVVWNDEAYGAEVHLYGEMGLDETPMYIPNINFAGLASALGAQGVRVERLDDLEALREWCAAGARGTILLDCQVSRSVLSPVQREVQRVNGVSSPPEQGRHSPS